MPDSQSFEDGFGIDYTNLIFCYTKWGIFMKPHLFTSIGKTILTVTVIATLSACGSMGNTDAIKDASELAIDCQTDKALAALDRADQGGGLAASLADLERVVILRDAGRASEATAAMAERNARAGADAEARAEAEEAVSESLDELRAERQKRTGSPVCP
jgi:hypothetical protein